MRFRITSESSTIRARIFSSCVMLQHSKAPICPGMLIISDNTLRTCNNSVRQHNARITNSIGNLGQRKILGFRPSQARPEDLYLRIEGRLSFTERDRSHEVKLYIN